MDRENYFDCRLIYLRLHWLVDYPANRADNLCDRLAGIIYGSLRSGCATRAQGPSCARLIAARPKSRDRGSAKLIYARLIAGDIEDVRGDLSAGSRVKDPSAGKGLSRIRRKSIGFWIKCICICSSFGAPKWAIYRIIQYFWMEFLLC